VGRSAGGWSTQAFGGFMFGIALSVLGSVYVAAVNLLASLLALGTLLSYSFFYTPLKRKSPL
jgi:heme O synthase-like polyprenyltransferase